jgi:DNA-binding winged helix-turn-helix (wHTH) protein/dipeptidyl aminopeptidase/acylaminoacyl peptidase
MTVTNHSVFRFYDVEVREAERRVTRAGEPLMLEPKTYRVLIHLLHHPGHLVTKNELLDAVWGDAVVTESSLTRAVALLRHVLEDDPHQPRFIETVATAGYRFVCPVEVSEDSHDSVASTDSANVGDRSQGETLPVKSQDGRRQKSRRRWLFSAPVLAVFLAAAIWYLHRPLPSLRVTGYTQITHDGHLKTLAGTDGNRLYFTDLPSVSTPGSIAQVAVSGGLIGQIPVAMPNPILVDISPDGSSFLIGSIAEVMKLDFSLWNVRILGGSARRLGEALTAAFSPDGNSVAYVAADGDGSFGIYIVRADGTGARKLVSIQGEVCSIRMTPNCRIVWSPDGSMIRFDRDAKIYEMKADGSGLHEFLAGWRPSSTRCCGRWTPDGKFFLFLSGESVIGGWGALVGEGGELWALDERRGLFRRPPTEPVRLTSGPISWDRPIPGKDGSEIFVEGQTQRGEASRYDAKSKQFQPFLGGISAQGVAFSKDGKSIAYVSYPEGILWKANRDGSNPVQLTDPPMQPFLPRWSPDGTQIVFTDIDNKWTIYIVSAEGGGPRKLLPEDHDSCCFPFWSPDGHKVVFTWKHAGEQETRILDLDSRQVTTVPGPNGMNGPRWSPDGRYLVAGALENIHLMVFDFKTQRWSELAQKGDVDSPEWSRDGKYIYFRRMLGDPGVFRIPDKGGAVEKIVDLKDWHDTGWFGAYMGLDPTDAPLLLRDIGSDEIYALTLERE